MEDYDDGVLRCAICGHVMVGDLEARQYAGTSGHKDFVQHTSR